MNFLEKITAIWQRVSLVQRALMIAVGLTIVIAGSFLTYWAQQPDMRVLFADLSAEEGSKITDKLIERNIAYQLRNGGKAIYVPREQVDQLRMDMAKEGLPIGDQGGYRIFDNEKIGISPFVQNINYKRALQDELAKSIQMIDGIVHARVHIQNAERKMFSENKKGSTASVALKFKPGFQISNSNVAAITHLISSGVEGLASENVTVIDSKGRLLSGQGDNSMSAGAGSSLDYRERVELRLSKKVEDMLAAVLGPNKASVKVSAEINMTSRSTITESYDPQKKVTSKEEIVTTSETEASKMSADGNSSTPGSVKKDETILNEYMVGKVIEEQTVLAGEITSLSVAAFVDLYPTVEPDENGETPATASKTKIMELADVEEIIKTALGLKETDTIKVVEAQFHKPVVMPIEESTPNWNLYAEIARQSSLGVMVICALLVLKIFGGGKKKKGNLDISTEALAPAQSSAGLITGSSMHEPQVLKRQIATALENNPEQVKNLFVQWLEEKG